MDLALNNLQNLICHKPKQSICTPQYYDMLTEDDNINVKLLKKIIIKNITRTIPQEPRQETVKVETEK